MKHGTTRNQKAAELTEGNPVVFKHLSQTRVFLERPVLSWLCHDNLKLESKAKSSLQHFRFLVFSSVSGAVYCESLWFINQRVKFYFLFIIWELHCSLPSNDWFLSSQPCCNMVLQVVITQFLRLPHSVLSACKCLLCSLFCMLCKCRLQNYSPADKNPRGALHGLRIKSKIHMRPSAIWPCPTFSSQNGLLPAGNTHAANARLFWLIYNDPNLKYVSHFFLLKICPTVSTIFPWCAKTSACFDVLLSLQSYICTTDFCI